MAVKQNNTESNGTATTGNGSTGGTGTNSKSNGGTAASGGGTKSKKLNSNLVNNASAGGFAGTVADGAGTLPSSCSGDTSADKSQQSLGLNTTQSKISGIGSGGSAGSNDPVVPNQGLAHILDLIKRVVELKQQQPSIFTKQITLQIYEYIITKLSYVPLPRPPEELKRFKEDINIVGEFFRNEKSGSLYCLHFVCKLITNNEETPTCAIAIIFELFNEEMIYEAVQDLLSVKIPDKNIQKTVRLLSEWLRMCNFCQNLNLWVLAILKGLQEQDKYELFYIIALENVEQLFSSLIVPVLRPKVAPIVLLMLSSVNRTPQVFHKILPKFPRDISVLKQQSLSLEKYADDTKKFLEQLVDLTRTLMKHFNGYDDLYKPIEHALKDFQPSYNYLNYVSANNNLHNNSLDNALFQHSKNAKMGLVNLGNTCYMNSVLQALAMTKDFSREVLLTESTSPLLIKMQQQIALMLYSTRYEMTPSRVLNAARPPGFSPGLQQDSSEFLGYLLETLHEQEVAFRKKSSSTLSSIVQGSNSDTDSEPIAKTSKQMQIVDKHNTNIAVEEGASAVGFNSTLLSNNLKNTTDTSENHNNNKKINITSRNFSNAASSTIITTTTTSTTNTTTTTLTTTVKIAKSANAAAALAVQSTIEKTFTGKLATTYKCLTCGWKSRNIDSFRDLQLSFPEVKNDCASNYSVQDLIDYYCSPEKLYGENQYFCEKCKKLSDAERFINVISAPKNLVLTLKHFKYDQKYHMRAKLMHKVFHDEKVSVKVCSAESLDEIASVHYDLYAGIVHSGFSMDSGHYYTYASDSSNKWYKFNDSVVTPSKSEELHNLTPPNTPYILFYQMGSRSNETPEASSSTSKVIKVDIPEPLTLEELPRDLRDYVNRDNCAFNEELKSRRLKLSNTVKQNAAFKAKGNGPRGDHYDDDDEDQPPPASGCGGNAMNINVNRFVY